ncbi:RNA polymerase sigma factor [soil metagenome]
MSESSRSVDTVLVGRARDGDVGAFNTLVDRHAASVYRVALRLLGDPDDASDATQDVFLRAWRALGGFREDSLFATWIYRMTTNRCLNQLRRQRPTTSLPEVMITTDAGPERIAESRQQLADLGRAMARLTPEQRAVLVLREFEHCSHQQIADTLGISVASVKSRLHRARIVLVSAMQEWR